MYAISVDTPEVSKAAINGGRLDGVTFPILSDEGFEAIDDYEVRDTRNRIWSKPATFIVDRDGIIRWHEVGSKNHRVNFSTVLNGLRTSVNRRTRRR